MIRKHKVLAMCFSLAVLIFIFSRGWIWYSGQILGSSDPDIGLYAIAFLSFWLAVILGIIWLIRIIRAR